MKKTSKINNENKYWRMEKHEHVILSKSLFD